MKKFIAYIATAICIVIIMIACTSNRIIFKNEITDSFGGIGVQWGVYEDVSVLTDEEWMRTVKYLDELKPSRIRCMANLEWWVVDFDNNSTYEDIKDDFWQYDYSKKTFKNLLKILEYCQNKDIKVAFGVWNVMGGDGITSPDMRKDVTSDERFVKMYVDIFLNLIKDRGFSCLKWAVATNEPNYKNKLNEKASLSTWVDGAKKLRQALDENGLESVGIVGGDTAGFDGCESYFKYIAENSPQAVDNYGAHFYIQDSDLVNGSFKSKLKNLIKRVRRADKFRDDELFDVWECGIFNGKNEQTDIQERIKTFDYGLQMADLTVQCVQAGINSLVYWDLDDAMYYKYGENYSKTPKKWGMFSTYPAAEDDEKALRPWFFSSCLLTNLMKEGCEIFNGEDSKKVRSICVKSKDGNFGVVAINRKSKDIERIFYLPDDCDNKNFYMYVYAQDRLSLDGEGFITYKKQVELDDKNRIEIVLPKNAMIIVSNEEI